MAPSSNLNASQLHLEQQQQQQEVYSNENTTNTADQRNASPTRTRGRAQSRTIRLIRDISPSTALRAFHSGSLSLGSGPKQLGDDNLRLDLTSCTFAEKDLGVRVAQAADKLRAWCAEIQTWGWSGSFELEQSSREQQSEAGAEAETKTKSVDGIAAQFARLPDARLARDARTPASVRLYERRLDLIEEELEKLDYDELKDHVLGLHHTTSRPGSSYSDISMNNLLVMNDYTILVTHTLMQSLPNMLLLRQYIETWVVRLSIFATCPEFLADLQHLRRGMGLAWQLLSLPNDASQQNFNLPAYRQVVSKIQKELQKKVSKLGRALDQMLDELEGRDDKLPDRWIDEFESLEAQYSEWTAKVQQGILEIEMKEERRKQAAARERIAREEAEQAPRRSSRSPVALRVHIPTRTNGSPQLDGMQQEAQSDGVPTPDDQSRVSDSEVVVRTAVRQPVPAAMLRRASSTSIRSISGAQVKRISVIRSASGSGQVSPKMRTSFEESRSSTPPVQVIKAIDKTARSQPQLSRHDSTLHIAGTPLAVTEEEPTSTEGASARGAAERQTSRHQDDLGYFPVVAASTMNSTVRPVLIETVKRRSRTMNGPSVPSSPARPTTPPAKNGQSGAHGPKTPASVVSSNGSKSSPQESPSKRGSWKVQEGALNAVMAKRRNKFKENLGTKTDPPQYSVPTNTSARASRRNVSAAQNMEQQISKILTALPTPIKLASKRRVSSNPAQTIRQKPSIVGQPLRRQRAPSLTLARATTPLPHADDEKTGTAPTRTRKSLGAEEPEIQLYHLSSSKGLAPTKLYIRRVGENGERLMVRVGGGWADLAEYLEQYAEHHGRRAVSGSHETVQVLDMQTSSGSNSPASTQPPNKDILNSANGSRRSSAGANLVHGTESPATVPSPLGTPTEAHGTREQTLHAITPTGFRRSMGSTDNGASLAGPRVKRLDLSGGKQEWIDEMVEKAKKASVLDLRRDKENDQFVDAGKVGSTRRVYMKGQ